MIKAKDIMTKEVITVSPRLEITLATELLLKHHFNGLPVVDEEGRLKGIICQEDLIVQQKQVPPAFFFHPPRWLDSLKVIQKSRERSRENCRNHSGQSHDLRPYNNRSGNDTERYCYIDGKA